VLVTCLAVFLYGELVFFMHIYVPSDSSHLCVFLSLIILQVNKFMQFLFKMMLHLHFQFSLAPELLK